jgi:hypothetical protein
MKYPMLRSNAPSLRSVLTVLGLAVCLSGCATRPVKASGPVLVSPNEDGGQITLTMRDCVTGGKNFTQEYPNLRLAYTYGNKTPYIEGCWTLIDGNVHVLYFHNNTRRVYSLDGFQRR